MVKLFQRVPEFALPAHDGGTVTLRDFLGRYLVLYFYPKAGTAGCTREAQEFTAKLPEFERLDAAVVSVSPDSPEAQARFVEREGIKVRMLSDSELSLARDLGAVKDGKVLRSTFLIDRTGVLRWRWPGVKARATPMRCSPSCETSTTPIGRSIL